MKQVEIAKKLGISKSYLSMILHGKRKPTKELSRVLSSQYSVNFEAMRQYHTLKVGGSKPPPPTIAPH